MLLTALALSATLQFDCPATIETRQQLLGASPGWQAVTRNDQGEQHQPLSHRLDNLSLFDGDPDERAQLKPDNGDSDALHYWSLDRRNPRPSIWSATIGRPPSPCSRRCPPASATAGSTSPSLTICAG